MSKFTSALVVENGPIDGHITLCFCDTEKAGKFSTFNGKGAATVVDVEYWEHVDITVLVVDCQVAKIRHEYYKSLGYTYDHEFIPHITVGRGDVVSDFIHLKGDRFIVGSEYARIY